MENTLSVSISSGGVSYYAHTGKWADQKLIDHICSAFDDYIQPLLEMHKRAEALIESSKGTDDYHIIIMSGVSTSWSKAGYEGDWDWCPSELEIYCDSLIYEGTGNPGPIGEMR